MKKKRLKLTHKLSIAQKLQIIARYCRDEPVKIIASDYKITGPAVSSLAKRYGAPVRRPRR